MNHEIQEWREPAYIDVALFLLAYGVVIVSAYYSQQTGDPLWFARSGSIMVIFSGALEFRQARIQQRRIEVASRTIGTFGGGMAPLELPLYRRIIIWTSHISLIIGTLIWGYGDELYKWFV